MAGVEDVGENGLAYKAADPEEGARRGVWPGDGEFELDVAEGV